MLSTAPKIEICPGIYPPSEDSELLMREMKVNPGESVLDMGTGSGILAVTAALHGGIVTAVDMSQTALDCATQNAKRNDVEILTIRSNLFENVKGTFDVILFNPPYLPAEEWSSISKGDNQWDGRGDGTETIRSFISQLGDHLGDRCYLLFSSLSGQGVDSIREAISGRFSYLEVARSELFFETLYVTELRFLS